MGYDEYDCEYDCYPNEYARSQAAFRMELHEKCHCNGCGWVCSNLDVWEPCPFHPGKMHPEDVWAHEERWAQPVVALPCRVVGVPVTSVVEDDDIPF